MTRENIRSREMFQFFFIVLKTIALSVSVSILEKANRAPQNKNVTESHRMSHILAITHNSSDTKGIGMGLLQV